MKLTTGYKKPIASSGTDALELSSNNSYLLLAGGGHKALSELVSPADLTTALSNYVTIGSNQTITGVKTFSLAINADITGNASTATNVNWSGVTNRPTNVSAFNNDVGYVTTDTTYSTATSDTLGLVKIGYTANGKNYPVQLSNGQMYVNVLWTDTWRPITDSYSGTSSNTSLSQNGGKAIYDALVNGYATNAGNAGTLNGYTSNDFVLKTTHDVYESIIAEALNDLDSRKADIADIPTSLPANGGNANTADYAAYLRGRDGNGVYFGKETSSNIIAEWNTKSDNRWYLKAASTNQCRVEYADKVDWTGIDNKPSYFTPSSHTHTTSEITNFPTIGNGALHIKVNGTELTPEGGIFTANKGGDSTIDLEKSLATRPEINTLGGRMDKIDTSIAGLTAATQIENKFDDSTEGNEEIIESNDEPYKDELGRIKLRFWNIANTIYDLPVYDVFVLPLATVKESFGNLSYYCEIFFVIGITDDSLVNSVGFTSGEYKSFFIRGANVKNKVCGFDVRGNGNVNSANACVTGGYLHLYCYLKLSGDSGTGNDIMEIAKNGKFEAYFCLRQTP